ncbi:MAG: hypothetical protein JWQ09_5897 [Segetibacter sp.]|nr:hypothetical protein [Segetibacter sp.]
MTTEEKYWECLSLDNMLGEVWQDIPEYNGKYQISSRCRVKSLKTYKILKQQKNPDGYFRVTLYDNCFISKKKIVHRLFANCFIPNPDNKPQVNHIDGNKRNNIISNLEWVTDSENKKHAYENKLASKERWRSSENPNSKHSVETILKIKEMLETTQCNTVAKLFGIPKSTVYGIQKGTRRMYDAVN